MKQAPKKWHQKFDEVILSCDYLLNQDDKCVYSKFDESGKGDIIFLYVDGMLIFGTNQVQVDLINEFLSSRFSMKDMREADVILRIRIKHESNDITISQSYYIEKVLKKFNYFDCTLVNTPIDTSEKLMPNNGQAVSQIEYSRVIGFLMYAMTCTRPDIAFVVGKLSRYTSNPNTQHWQAIPGVLKCLKKTMDYSLTYISYPSVLEGYTDASWISNTEDNPSTSGWVFLLGGVANEVQAFLLGKVLERVIRKGEDEELPLFTFGVVIGRSRVVDKRMKKVFSIWKTFEGNTRDLGSFREETDKTTDLHQHCLRISPQKLETASQITRDAVINPTTTASQDIATASACMIQPII
ncbi:zinc finger, CCHC-type containing protein [Tanacetum coccineum]